MPPPADHPPSDDQQADSADVDRDPRQRWPDDHGGRLSTVGYEGRSLPELVASLVDDGVGVLVDVRLRASSRRRGFARTALSSALSDAGVRYLHRPALGNPRENRDAYRAGSVEARAVFDSVLATPAAESALAEIRSLLATTRVALLCYEADPAACHRTQVAAALAG